MDILFLDDERYIEDVTWVKYPSYDNVHILRRECDFMFAIMHIDCIKDYLFSFDHDLQDFDVAGNENTGYTCAKWLCDYILDRNWNPDDLNYVVHTKNPIGGKNIISYIENFKTFYRENGV